MTKSKARIDYAVACDLGLVLSTHATTIREIAENPENVLALLFAYEDGEITQYDLVPLWREINGMRIKLPKFQLHPIIEERLSKQFYQRYYVAHSRTLTPIKLKSTAEFARRLPFETGNLIECLTSTVVPELIMGLRAKPLLFHRRKIQYEHPHKRTEPICV
jgi:hypothetical protein